jgi:hypothetical protein
MSSQAAARTGRCVTSALELVGKALASPERGLQIKPISATAASQSTSRSAAPSVPGTLLVVQVGRAELDGARCSLAKWMQ